MKVLGEAGVGCPGPGGKHGKSYLGIMIAKLEEQIGMVTECSEVVKGNKLTSSVDAIASSKI